MRLENKEEADKARLAVAIAKLNQSGEISAAKIMQNFKRRNKMVISVLGKMAAKAAIKKITSAGIKKLDQ
jgi:hypothetical protein